MLLLLLVDPTAPVNRALDRTQNRAEEGPLTLKTRVIYPPNGRVMRITIALNSAIWTHPVIVIEGS